MSFIGWLGRLFLGSLAVLMLPSPSAHAGLIPWSYSGSGGQVGVESDLLPPAGGHGILSLTGATSSAQSGSARVPVIAGTSFQVIAPGNEDFIIVGERTGVSVVITDTASGFSGSVGWEVRVSGVPDSPVFELVGADAWNFDLGKNHYTVTPVGDGTAAQVDVAMVATPEPSALVLAALGLAGWYVTARLRSRAVAVGRSPRPRRPGRRRARRAWPGGGRRRPARS